MNKTSKSRIIGLFLFTIIVVAMGLLLGPIFLYPKQGRVFVKGNISCIGGVTDVGVLYHSILVGTHKEWYDGNPTIKIYIGGEIFNLSEITLEYLNSRTNVTIKRDDSYFFNNMPSGETYIARLDNEGYSFRFYNGKIVWFVASADNLGTQIKSFILLGNSEKTLKTLPLNEEIIKLWLGRADKIKEVMGGYPFPSTSSQPQPKEAGNEEDDATGKTEDKAEN